MTDKQVRMLLRLTKNEAKMLLDQGEHYLYRSIQDQLVELVRKNEVRLPLNCLQFLYNGYYRKTKRCSGGSARLIRASESIGVILAEGYSR